MLLLSLKILRKWLMMTEFEMFLNVFAILASTIVLCIKIDVYPHTIKWSHVFMPLFVCDGLQVYFNFIVFIRMYRESTQHKLALLYFIFTSIILVLKFLFKILLYYEISGFTRIQFSLISIPLFFLFGILMCRTCLLRNERR